MGALNLNAITKLATVDSVDLNIGDPQVLYRIPLGYVLLVDHVVIYNATVNLDTASFGFGFAGLTADGVIAAALHLELIGSDIYKIVPAKAGADIGNEDDTFGITCSVLQGVPATVSIDVFGYLIKKV